MSGQGLMVMQVIPDRFNSKTGVGARQAFDRDGRGGVAGASRFIRRPTRGIVLKEDSFATLRVVTGKGERRPLIDAGSRRPNKDSPMRVGDKVATDVYSNFFIQTVTEERMEKQQILETFGEPYIFFFGERARVMNFQGILMNSWDFNWEAEWWENYENEIRGTRCVENDAQVFLHFDDTLIGGYVIGTSAQKSAQDRNWVNFGFQMFVTSYANLSNVGSPIAYDGVPRLSAGKSLKDLQYSQEKLSPDDLATMRPRLIDETPSADAAGMTDYDRKISLVEKLTEGWSNAMGFVSNAWNKIDSTLNNSMLMAEGLINGDTIRVPVGFQGSMAFDDQADVTQVRADWGAAVKYTVFQDNDDEYVGVADQYASAQLFQNGWWGQNVRYLGWDSWDSEVQSSAQQLAVAKDAWAEAGLLVPDAELGAIIKVTRDAAQKGLVVATGIQNWSAYLTSKTPNNGTLGPVAGVIAP